MKQQLELRALEDDTTTPADGNLNLRVVHAAPFAADLAATAVSIRTDDGMVVNNLSNVPYNVQSGFFEVPAGTYDLKVASPDGSVNYIDPLAAALPAGANVTIYAIVDGAPIFYTFDSCMEMAGVCSNSGGFDGEMTTTDLYLNTGGGSAADDTVMTTKVGEIDFEFDGCLFAMATVRLDGEMPEMYNGANLTAAFCNDEL